MKRRIFPSEESTFYSVYSVSEDRQSELLDTLDHIKLKGEILISVASNRSWYTIVAAKP